MVLCPKMIHVWDTLYDSLWYRQFLNLCESAPYVAQLDPLPPLLWFQRALSIWSGKIFQMKWIDKVLLGTLSRTCGRARPVWQVRSNSGMVIWKLRINHGRSLVIRTETRSVLRSGQPMDWITWLSAACRIKIRSGRVLAMALRMVVWNLGLWPAGNDYDTFDVSSPCG